MILFAASQVVSALDTGFDATTAVTETPKEPDLVCLGEDGETTYLTKSWLIVYEIDDEGTIDESFFPNE
ncbi:MAG: hypothetical protein ACQETB_11045 [Halobacteriota archaeon]